jgi:cytochrome c oxidase cbb3-type subunit 3
MLKIKNTILLFMAGYCSISVNAQTTQATTTEAPTNYLEWLMVVIAALLVIVIWVLSNVLMMVSKKVVEKAKQNGKGLMLLFLILGTLFANQIQAQTVAVADSTAKASVNFYGGLSSTTFWTLSTVMLLELLVILLLVIFIRNLWKVIHPSAVVVAAVNGTDTSWMLNTWRKLDKQFFTKAAPIEHEADILLDHDYDGIKELDNALPPWWKYGFFITILVAVFYLLKYEVWQTGPNPTQEYATEMNDAKAQVDAYLASAKENVDEKTVTMLDAAGIDAGKQLFAKTCIACHMSKGEGGVGPNLTDEYWLHGGSIHDVFKTIKYGYPDKGMQSWQSTYSPVQIQQLASYVKSLKGSNPPNPKAPQGEIYKEVVVLDSVSNVSKKR